MNQHQQDLERKIKMLINQNEILLVAQDIPQESRTVLVEMNHLREENQILRDEKSNLTLNHK